jgi:hypothetical protein
MSMTDAQDTLFGDPDPEPVRMLTVQQPMAWAIIHAGKDVENSAKLRTFRGRLVIHAGQTVNPEYVAKLEALGVEIPPEALQGGHIVGSVTQTDCVKNSTSRWATPGRFHNVLSAPVAASQRVTARGQVGLVNPPAGWEQAFAA